MFEGLRAGVAVDGAAMGCRARGVLTPVVYMGEGSSVGVVPAYWKGVEEQ